MVEKIELVFTIKYYFLDYPRGEDVNFIESILVQEENDQRGGNQRGFTDAIARGGVKR